MTTTSPTVQLRYVEVSAGKPCIATVKGNVTIFVNGSYIATIPLEAGGSYSGGAGLIVLNHGVEAVFSNFTLYSVGA